MLSDREKKLLGLVKSDPSVLEELRDPSLEFVSEVVKANVNYFWHQSQLNDTILKPLVRELPTSQLVSLVEEFKGTPAMKILASTGKISFAEDLLTYDEKIALLTADGNNLWCIREQTPELCLVAVQKDGRALRYVRNQTPELCLAAITSRCDAIMYVHEQTPELCDLALQGCIDLYKHGITKLTRQIAANVLIYSKYLDEQLCVLLIKKDPVLVSVIRNPSEQLSSLAVELNPGVLRQIRLPSLDLCKLAVEKDESLMEVIKQIAPHHFSACIEYVRESHKDTVS